MKIIGLNSHPDVQHEIHSLFLKGRAFTHSSYHTFGAGQIKDFIFNPSAFTGRQMFGFFPSFTAEAGPILIDYYAGVTPSGSEANLLIFNRYSASIIAQSKFSLEPSPLGGGLGTLFTNDAVTAAATGSGQSVPGIQEDRLFFNIDFSTKYLIRLTNQNGADTLVTIRFTFFEIP